MLFFGSAQAEVDVTVNCFLGGGGHTANVPIVFGSGFHYSPLLGATNEERLIGASTIYLSKQLSCPRQVVPDQFIQLDAEAYVGMPTEKTGSIFFDGLPHGLYPVQGQPNLGIIVRIHAIPADADNTISPVSYWPADETPVNHNGFASVPDWKVSNSIKTNNSNTVSTVGYFSVHFFLVWLGPIPVTATPSEMETMLNELTGKTIITIKYRHQTVSNSVVGWGSYDTFDFVFANNQFIYSPAIGTCTTPPAGQLVKLPMVWANEFTGEGTTSGETDFDLTFSGCSLGMYTIRHKLYSTNPTDNTDAANAAKGLLSLNNQPGSAAGIKVQILDRDTDLPITLDQFRIAPQYTSFESSVTIPFKARYYQSESQVTAGKVRATAYFQIIYQ